MNEWDPGWYHTDNCEYVIHVYVKYWDNFGGETISTLGFHGVTSYKIALGL